MEPYFECSKCGRTFSENEDGCKVGWLEEECLCPECIEMEKWDISKRKGEEE